MGKQQCAFTMTIELPDTVTLDDSRMFVLFNDALAKYFGASTRIVTMAVVEEG
jgi:hypothetical protein